PGQGPKIPEVPSFAKPLIGIGANWGTGGNRPTLPTPKSVIWAFLLSAASSAASILYSIFVIISFASYVGYAGFAGGGSVVFSIIIAVGLFVLAVMMRNGAEWARLVLAGLAGLSLLFGLIGLFGVGLLFTAGGGIAAIALIFLIIQLAAQAG